jgi:uncharacterized protein (TIGR00369 family)
MRTLPPPYRQSGCFFCGPDNPVGLKLTFSETETEPNEIVCRWVPPTLYKGFGQILHGGIQTGLFDEIMGWATLHLTRKVGVTSRLEVDFLKPLFVEQEIEARCRIESLNGKKVSLAAEIRNQDGEVCSKASGIYVLMERDRFAQVVGE